MQCCELGIKHNTHEISRSRLGDNAEMLSGHLSITLTWPVKIPTLSTPSESKQNNEAVHPEKYMAEALRDDILLGPSKTPESAISFTN